MGNTGIPATCSRSATSPRMALLPPPASATTSTFLAKGVPLTLRMDSEPASGKRVPLIRSDFKGGSVCVANLVDPVWDRSIDLPISQSNSVDAQRIYNLLPINGAVNTFEEQVP